ncbi:hypothetical protein YC2023_047343 [Brassica napus]
MGIKSVVEDGVSGLLNEAMWSACEMSSVWMQSELSQNQTQERILAYAAEVVLAIKHVQKQNSNLCEFFFIAL